MSERDQEFETRLLESASMDASGVDEQVAWALFATRTASIAALLDASSGVHALPASASQQAVGEDGAARPEAAGTGAAGTGAASAASTGAASAGAVNAASTTAVNGVGPTAGSLAAGATHSSALSTTGAAIGAGASGAKLLAPAVLTWLALGSVVGAVATASAFLLLTPQLRNNTSAAADTASYRAANRMADVEANIGVAPVSGPSLLPADPVVPMASGDEHDGKGEGSSVAAKADEPSAPPAAMDGLSRGGRPPRPGSQPASAHHASTERGQLPRTASTQPSGAGAAPAKDRDRSKGTLPAVLEQEVRLVDNARASLLGARAEQALEWIAQYRREFPLGALSRDIDFVEIEALYDSGRRGRGRDRARRFLKRYPEDPHAPAVERLLDRDE